LRRAIGPLLDVDGEGIRLRAALLLLARHALARHPAKSAQLLRLARESGESQPATDALERDVEELLAMARQFAKKIEKRKDLRWLVNRRFGRTQGVPIQQMTAREHGVIDEFGKLIEAESDSKVKELLALRLREALVVERTFSTHDDAYLTLLTSIGRNLPFALYLRNFNLEASVVRFKDDMQLTRSKFDGKLNRTVESDLVRCFAPFIPVVGIENPDDPWGWSGGVPRFEVPDGSWQEVFDATVRHAHLILLYYEKFTPGIVNEIETIRRLGRENATVLIRARTQADTSDKEQTDAITEDMVKLAERQYGSRTPRVSEQELELGPGFRILLTLDAIPATALDHDQLRPIVEHAIEIEYRNTDESNDSIE
jgi:hypothetical protein